MLSHAKYKKAPHPVYSFLRIWLQIITANVFFLYCNIICSTFRILPSLHVSKYTCFDGKKTCSNCSKCLYCWEWHSDIGLRQQQNCCSCQIQDNMHYIYFIVWPMTRSESIIIAVRCFYYIFITCVQLIWFFFSWDTSTNQ